MPFFPLPKYAHPDFSRPGVKPSGSVVIDQQSTYRPDHLWGFARGGYAKDFVGSIDSNAATGTAHVDSRGMRLSGTGNSFTFPDTDHSGNSSIFCDRDNFTISCAFSYTGTNSPGIIGDYTGTSNVSVLLFFSSGGQLNFRVRAGATVTNIASSASYNNGQRHSVVADWRDGTMNLWVDRQLVATGARTGTTTSGFSNTLQVGGYGGANTNNPSGTIEYISVSFNKSPIQGLLQDEFCFLKPAVGIQAFWSAGGGTNYPLTADVGALTLSGGTVTFTKDQSITLDVGALTLAGDAVTFTHNTGGVYELTADVGALTLGSDAATFSLGYNLTADVGALTIAGDAVTFSSGYNLTADVGDLTLSGDSVTFSKTQGITLDVGALTLSGGTATFTVGVLASPDCTTFLESIIVEAYFLTSYIDDSGEFYQSVIDGGPFFLESDIDGRDLFLEGGLC
jgi:hypothetical protein